MKTTCNKTAMFDLDGVVVDSEHDYDRFWNRIGKQYLPMYDNFASLIKGNTLDFILEHYFADFSNDIRQEIVAAGIENEKRMNFDYINGAHEFISELRRNKVKTALVTSSSDCKLSLLAKKRPELQGMFDYIVSANSMARSKPYPDGYLKAAEALHASPDTCVVFEDSLNGLDSGRAAGMYVVGVATTNKPHDIVERCDKIISDFSEIDFEVFCRLF